jgi:hypothetical protein
MQRILLSLCTGTLLLFVQPKIQAQEHPPSVKRNLIGGSVGFGYAQQERNASTNHDRTNTAVSFSPVYAYYFRPNVAIGASLGYTYNKNKYFSNWQDIYTTSSYSFRPFIRFEIPLWQSRFAIYNDLGIYGGYVKNTVESDSVKYSWSSWGTGAFYEPGLMFRLKSNIMLQASIGTLLSYDYNGGGGTYSHNFGIRNNRGTDDFRLGINYMF